MLLFQCVVGISGAVVVVIFFYISFLLHPHGLSITFVSHTLIHSVSLLQILVVSWRDRYGNTNTHTSHHSKFITEAVVVRSPHCRCRGRGRVYCDFHSYRCRRSRSCSLYNGRKIQNVCVRVREREKQENREETRDTHRKMHFFNFHTQTHANTYTYIYIHSHAWYV